jgi:hypothetical protein
MRINTLLNPKEPDPPLTLPLATSNDDDCVLINEHEISAIKSQNSLPVGAQETEVRGVVHKLTNEANGHEAVKSINNSGIRMEEEVVPGIRHKEKLSSAWSFLDSKGTHPAGAKQVKLKKKTTKATRQPPTPTTPFISHPNTDKRTLPTHQPSKEVSRDRNGVTVEVEMEMAEAEQAVDTIEGEDCVGVPADPSKTSPSSKVLPKQSKLTQKKTPAVTKKPTSMKKRSVEISRSTRYKNQANERLEHDTFVADEKKMARFKKKILKMDVGAQTQVLGNIRMVRHSKCDGVLLMKQPYDT